MKIRYYVVVIAAAFIFLSGCGNGGGETAEQSTEEHYLTPEEDAKNQTVMEEYSEDAEFPELASFLADYYKVPEEYMQESTVRTAPLDESELHAEVQKEPAEPRHVNVENRIANQKREPVAQRPRAEEVVVEAEGDKNEEAAVAAETVEVAATAPAVEETVEVKAEQKTQSALERLTEGLDEALAKNGLTVVHTKPELVHPVDYSPVIYPGRPRKVLPPLDDTPLIQVHTTKF